MTLQADIECDKRCEILWEMSVIVASAVQLGTTGYAAASVVDDDGKVQSTECTIETRSTYEASLEMLM